MPTVEIGWVEILTQYSRRWRATERRQRRWEELLPMFAIFGPPVLLVYSVAVYKAHLSVFWESPHRISQMNKP